MILFHVNVTSSPLCKHSLALLALCNVVSSRHLYTQPYHCKGYYSMLVVCIDALVYIIMNSNPVCSVAKHNHGYTLYTNV